MKVTVGFLVIIVVSWGFTGVVNAQEEQMCTDLGIISEVTTPIRRTLLVFGRVSVKPIKGEVGKPKVVVWLREGGRSTQRLSVESSASYCFVRNTTGGEVSLEVDGLEVARRPLMPYAIQQREDFDVSPTSAEGAHPPGVVSVKFFYKRSDKNARLYEKALKLEADGKPDKAIGTLNEIVSADPGDYIAWGKIGSLYYQQQKYPDAADAFRRSVDAKSDFVPAWLNLGQAQFAQKQFEAAIESCKRAAELDPNSAQTFYILGQTYLQAREGKLAIAAFYQAIKLDPVGMAECHIILANLYDLNGAKRLASHEYSLFLSKIPNYPERGRLEKYIKENPE